MSDLLEALRLHKPLPVAPITAAAIAYKTASPHKLGPNGGECALTLNTLPVRVTYELTFDGCDEIAEVTEVCISGHVIDAGDFAADIRAEWGRQCMNLRGVL